jgi:hypothetical protein
MSITDDELSKLIQDDGDNCTLCRRPFVHDDWTCSGFTAEGRLAVVGECCHKQIHELVAFGHYLRTH